jgi:hypothetical protein
LTSYLESTTTLRRKAQLNRRLSTYAEIRGVRPLIGVGRTQSLEAGNGIRTRDPQLGKLMLYQLSYPRIQTRFYPAQDLVAHGIYKLTNPTGGAVSALWGTAKKTAGGLLGQK